MAPKQVLHRSSIVEVSDESIVLVLLTLQDRMSLSAEKQDGLRFLFELLNPATLYSIKSLIGASVRHRLDDEQIALDVFCDMTPYLLGERPFKNASLNGLLSLCRKIAKSKVINEVTKIGRLRRQEPIMQSLISELQEKTREAPDQIAEWREEVENWIQKLNSPELSAVLVYRMEGLSIKDVASRLKITRRTVQRRWARISLALTQYHSEGGFAAHFPSPQVPSNSKSRYEWRNPTTPFKI
jgi:hypothetical protein